MTNYANDVLIDQSRQSEARKRERGPFENVTLGASKLREYNLQVTN